MKKTNETTIKCFNKQNTKFAINGKLAVIRYGPGKKVLNISYNIGLTQKEDEDFKGHLKVLKLI